MVVEKGLGHGNSHFQHGSISPLFFRAFPLLEGEVGLNSEESQ